MRILVCGGRSWGIDRDFTGPDGKTYHYNAAPEREKLRKTLREVFKNPNSVLIHGAAKGADSLAADWAFDNGFMIEEFPAEWDKHGKHAGPIRNTQMLLKGKPDLVVAFPGGKGTAHMVKIASKNGVKVIEI